MRFFPQNAFCLFCLLFLLSACSSPVSNSSLTINKHNNSNTNTEATKDDIEDFAKIVKLPFQPEEVSWRESADKKIIAVLKFSAADANNLTTQIEKQKPAQNAGLNAENWFPPELIAQSQQSGDETLKGKEYSAADFFLAPYTKGKITRIDETNYFVLELSAQ
ncbi:MAG TPA: hypothetical protein PKE69_05830 [Pyrinomonadaceae bacterium]|nr:hypothetical protein [Pyrinomonadaceae bacterium]